MPSRPVAALIVLFWLGSLGWFGYRDLWPRFNPGDVPPFVIEMEDELVSQFRFDPTRTADVIWKVTKNDQEIGRAQTRLRYVKEDNSFELQSRVVKLELIPRTVEVPELTTTYKLTRQGELRGLDFKGQMTVMGITADAEFRGEVREGKLHRTGWIKLPFFADRIVPELEPVDAPTGAFLNPLHPVPRIKGLRPGRRWVMQVVDPLADAVGPSIRAIQQRAQPGAAPLKLSLPAGPKTLQAEVLPDTVRINYNGADTECYVIEYRGEHEKLRTFVRVSDGWVLRQESKTVDALFVMQRA